jgi:hypothetical protein
MILQNESLPHLQSLVIVLLRPIFANVAAIVSQQGSQPGVGMAGRGNNTGMNGAPNRPRDQEGSGQTTTDASEMSPEEVDAARTREITTKAMSGILVLLLKWLRLSRTYLHNELV